MPLALVKITKEYDGEEWENVWCIGTGNDDDTGFSEIDWNGYTGGSEPDFENTDPATASADLQNGDSIINSLIAFERVMHSPLVKFTRLFAWDGSQNGLFSSFVARPLSFYGLQEGPLGDALLAAPGNVTWMIGKAPAVFGKRSGRAYLRMCLGEGHVKPGGKYLLDWQNPVVAAERSVYLQFAITESGLDKFFASGTNIASSRLMIPHFTVITDGDENNPPTGGDLASGAEISGLASIRPASRQVKRGRRKRQLPS